MTKSTSLKCLSGIFSKTKQNLKNAYHSFNPPSMAPLLGIETMEMESNIIRSEQADPQHHCLLCRSNPKLTSAKDLPSFQGSNLLLNKYKFKECKSASLNVQ